MGTRAAAFAAKIRNLQDYHTRIQKGTVPLPNGIDVANTLKYFSQTLLSVLRDVPSIPLEVLQAPDKDHSRTTLFPSLDYKGLYHVIVQLVDCVPLVQYGAHALGSNILQTLACLVPFLEHEYIDTLPYIVASSLALFPPSLQDGIVELLCYHLLPFTIVASSDYDSQNYANMSTPAVIMMVFQYAENPAHHAHLLECLMSLKRNIIKDLLCVIGHGTADARRPAVELLFHYWPSLNPMIQERRSTSIRHAGWKPLVCQRENCVSTVNNDAVKLCMDHSLSIGTGEHPPPLYVCQGCADQIHRENSTENLVNVLLPLQQVALLCENKNCQSINKKATVTCFSIECSSYNGNHPIRYCIQCYNLRHKGKQGSDHVVHGEVPNPWTMDPETQSYMVEAIVSLLQEARPFCENETQVTTDRYTRAGVLEKDDSMEFLALEERQLLSRYGIWLLKGLCTPTDDTPVETLGRLLSVLFQWFHYTACLPDDHSGNALERLKTEYIQGWLMEIIKSHFEVFVSCLLPHPAEYACVGGYWEKWPSQMNCIKEGFKRLLCLVPYDIITLEVWNYIMPYWMEAFRSEMSEEELSEMKILLSKVLDPDLSPLGLNTTQMYKFLSIRFESDSPLVQEQALHWLQVLTMLEVPFPLNFLLCLFSSGIESFKGTELGKANSEKVVTQGNILWPDYDGVCGHKTEISCPQQPAEGSSDMDINVNCFILMLDVFIKQLELQEVSPHRGLEGKEAQQSMTVMRNMLKAPWQGIHTCQEKTDDSQCSFCELCSIWYQLALALIEYFCPVMEVTMSDIPSEPLVSEGFTGISPKHASRKSDSRKISSPLFEREQKINEETVSLEILKPSEVTHSEEKSLGSPGGDSLPPIMTAVVQECEAELDTVAIMPTEQVVTAYARAVTLTEDDVAVAKCNVTSATLVDENDQTVLPQQDDDHMFWHTSQGKFKFTFDELPAQLQLLYFMLKELANFDDPDVLYHLLFCLKLLCLHAEVLNKAAQDHKGFLIWCQENLLVESIWKLLQTEFSHISQIAVPLLLHCVTLPSGADMFWKVVEDGFHSKSWRSRFAAVERVTVIAHFIESSTVKNSPLLQSSLANAFCYFVQSVDDIQSIVAQRALLNLKSVKTSSLKLLVWCLEAQFDTMIIDRPMILHTIYQLYNHLYDRRFITWDFFLNRFDTLFLEAQLSLERIGEVTYARDLKNTNMNSEIFQKKLSRAHEALSLSTNSRSLSASVGIKCPYKRAMSAPGGMIYKQDKSSDKEKIYSRQSSAPVLKRKSSKLAGAPGGGPSLQHLPNSFFPDGHLKELVQEEYHFNQVLHHVMDLEDHDKDTLHLLVFLLMQFLSREDHSHPSEEKAMARNQHIILRHLNILLGYNPAEKGFLIPPHKLRNSPVFRAFLVSLPKVLDYNFKIGNILLNICLPVLIYCPSPQRFAYEHQLPSFSLWLLDSHARHSWLVATLVILYKYRYSSPPYCKQVQMLIHIVLNTLEAQHHVCKYAAGPLLSPVPSRFRDFSCVTGDVENLQDHYTPPNEPPSSTDEVKLTFSGTVTNLRGLHHKALGENSYSELGKDQSPMIYKEKTDWKTKKLLDYGCSCDDDVEPELEAIPESPKSESSGKDIGELELSSIETVSVLTEQARVRVVKENGLTDHVVVFDPSKTTSVCSNQTPKDTYISQNSFSAFPVSEILETDHGNCQSVRDAPVEKFVHESMEKDELKMAFTCTRVMDTEQNNTDMKMLQPVPSTEIYEDIESYDIYNSAEKTCHLNKPDVFYNQREISKIETEVCSSAFPQSASEGLLVPKSTGYKEEPYSLSVSSSKQFVNNSSGTLQVSVGGPSIVSMGPAFPGEIASKTVQTKEAGVGKDVIMGPVFPEKVASKTVQTKDAGVGKDVIMGPVFPEKVACKTVQTKEAGVGKDVIMGPVFPEKVASKTVQTKDAGVGKDVIMGPVFPGKVTSKTVQTKDFEVGKDVIMEPVLTGKVANKTVQTKDVIIMGPVFPERVASKTVETKEGEVGKDVIMEPILTGKVTNKTVQTKDVIIMGPVFPERVASKTVETKEGEVGKDNRIVSLLTLRDYTHRVPHSYPSVSSNAKTVSHVQGEEVSSSTGEFSSGITVSKRKLKEPYHQEIVSSSHDAGLDKCTISYTQTDPFKQKPRIQRMGAFDTGSVKVKSFHDTNLKVSEIESKTGEIKNVSHENLYAKQFCSVFGTESNVSSLPDHNDKKAVSTSDKQNEQCKPLWHVQIHRPIHLESISNKPNPERLLPVGIPEKNLRAASYPTNRSITEDTVSKCHPQSSVTIKSSEEAPERKILESFETEKAVQTPKYLEWPAHKDIHFPAEERLLPIGTPPKRTRNKTKSFDESEGSVSLYSGPHFAQTQIFNKVPVMARIETIETGPANLKTLVVTTIPSSFQNSASTKGEESNIETNEQSENVPCDALYHTACSSVIEHIEEEPQTDGIKEQFPEVTTNKLPAWSSFTFPESKSSIDIEWNKNDGMFEDLLPPEYSGSDSLERRISNDDCIECHSDKELTDVYPEKSSLEKSDSFDSKDDDDHGKLQKEKEDVKSRLHYRPKKQRKMGLSSMEIQRLADPKSANSRRRKTEVGSNNNSVGFLSKRSSTSQSSGGGHVAEDTVTERCSECGGVLQEFSNEELGLCIVILSTYVHREPILASSLLPEMFQAVSKNTYLPGGAGSVARQFLRCTLHQLAPYGVFTQIFSAEFVDTEFFKTMAQALTDFCELNQISPLIYLFENLNEKKQIPHDNIFHILENVTTYMECLPLENCSPLWGAFLPQVEIFLRKLLLTLPTGPCNLTPAIRIMLAVIKMPPLLSYKSLLEPMSKVLSLAIQFSPLCYKHLLELCHLCNRNFARERDKQMMTRTTVFELVQALKFKSTVPDENLLMLVQFVLQDVGGCLGSSVMLGDFVHPSEIPSVYSTGASECMRQNLHDALEFITDVHTLSKIKSSLHGTSARLNEETLGGQLKAGIAQYLAIEISKGNGRDNRAISKYLPWLYNPPSTLQQGPKEFIDCVAHIRLLSWLLLGSLMHSTLLHSATTFVCQPVPLEANCHIAEHIQVILAGFAEQSKASVLHMSSLFHGFILCQLWTMYCEHMVSLNPPGSEQNTQCSLTLADFWAKVTPGILQLVCHSKVEGQYQLAEMVTLHFLSLMEALMECNSTGLARLLPMWTPVLYTYKGQLPGHLKVRLQACLNWQPSTHTHEEAAAITSTFLKWLQRLQFKMGQIELQSSAATQFYSV
ncbi:UNC-79 domain-containing protein isoform X3 [Tachypleus tridentatus]|uniref:UNC-79 domain-containing protein isoform X3 n=1 Tax=Tachypleus tridentatus TaxID=6853 RepID=UPI003FD04117